jgi:F-type H+-transporting ATPase subunit b
MSKHIRICILAVGLLLASGVLFAQSSSQAEPPAATLSAQPAGAVQSQAVNKASEAPRDEEEEENAQFKYSPIVRKLAGAAGLSKEAAYWIFVIINFAILAAGLGWVVRKVLPNGFAPRTAEIQKSIEEARKASAEASTRLAEIEGRLARLDTEIAAIRTAAEADFTVEEQRIKAAAEQDAKNVIAAAEQEIAAASRVAQRELKSFVADLAVTLAEKKIKVDDTTDQALVRSFAAELGKDGQ